MAKKSRRLGEILYRAGVVPKEPLLAAIKESKSSGRRLGELLLEKKLIGEETLIKALAKQHGMHYVDIDNVSVPQNAAELVSEDLMRRFNVLPLGMDNGRLKLAIGDPMDLDMMDTLRLRLNKEIMLLLVGEVAVDIVTTWRDSGIPTDLSTPHQLRTNCILLPIVV